MLPAWSRLPCSVAGDWELLISNGDGTLAYSCSCKSVRHLCTLETHFRRLEFWSHRSPAFQIDWLFVGDLHSSVDPACCLKKAELAFPAAPERGMVQVCSAGKPPPSRLAQKNCRFYPGPLVCTFQQSVTLRPRFAARVLASHKWVSVLAAP